MTTKVIHMKDAPKDWKTNPDFVYIGRSGKGLDGFWGNPYRMYDEDERKECLARYEKWMFDRIEKDPEFKEKVMGLKNKTLICFCAPAVCHGNVLANYVDWESEKK